MRVIFCLSAALALSACGPSKEELQDRLDEAEGRASSLAEELETANAKIDDANDSLDDAQQQLTNLQTSISDLDDKQRRFAYESWQFVVPDIREGVESTSANATELDRRLQEVESALGQ